MTHRASIPGAPVSTTICPVPGDTCPASVPGPQIVDVVKVGYRTTVLDRYEANFLIVKWEARSPLKSCQSLKIYIHTNPQNTNPWGYILLRTVINFPIFITLSQKA